VLSIGGLAIDYDEVEEEEEYEGLDVGGKKMDWALEHRAPVGKKFTRTAAHIAAAYNQSESVEFLSNRALSIWNDFIASTRQDMPTEDDDDDDDEPEDYSVHFSFLSTDAKGRTPLYYAVGSNAAAAARAVCR
jgi:hypothetical protein